MAAVTPNSEADFTEVEAPGETASDETELQLPSDVTQPSAAISTPLAPGMTLGDYFLEAVIGRGGMGDVYSAVHPLIGKRAAIKVLRKSLCADPLMVQRFIDEARAVNQIGHPNIVDVFAFGETTDGRCFLAMEWLKGESLRDALERGPLEVREACRIARQLARALEAAHEKGVIHRDLKPDNAYLVEVRGEPPRVKLLDFGIAKLVDETHRPEQTATGALVGTPQYMAPEQARGYQIDARVDVYALGCVVFELVSGRTPFVADNAADMIASQLADKPPRLSSRVNVPRELDDLIARMLAKRADDRPALGEVEAILERLADGRTTHSMTPVPSLRRPVTLIGNALRTPVSWIDQVVRRARTMIRRAPRWLVHAAVIVGVLLAAGFGFSIARGLLGSSSKPAPAIAPASSEPAPAPVVAGPERPTGVEPSANQPATAPIVTPAAKREVAVPAKPRPAPKATPPKRPRGKPPVKPAERDAQPVEKPVQRDTPPVSPKPEQPVAPLDDDALAPPGTFKK